MNFRKDWFWILIATMDILLVASIISGLLYGKNPVCLVLSIVGGVFGIFSFFLKEEKSMIEKVLLGFLILALISVFFTNPLQYYYNW